MAGDYLPDLQAERTFVYRHLPHLASTESLLQELHTQIFQYSTTMWYYHNVEFIESRAFTARLHQLAGDSAGGLLHVIQQDLLANPDRGAMVPGLGGVRKARLANPARGKGKRGGYRYLYLYLEKRQHIHLLILLDKNEQEDASAEQRRQIREWVARIKREAGG